MAYILEERPLHPFLFMGCWNQPGQARDAVAAAVRQRSEEMIVLGGDNIYPEKRLQDGAIRKVYSIDVLDSGVDLLGTKTMYASLGNHNVAVPDILDHEMEMPWILPNSYYCARFSDDYALVVLDTNAEGKQFDAMISWFVEIQTTLKEHNVPYYLVQHEPYASYKKGKQQVLRQGAAILEHIDYAPLAILCADTHNYQRGYVSLPNGSQILQIVAGTGGAHHDPLGASGSFTASSFTGSIMYTLTEHIPGYGFVSVDVGNIRFVKVMDWPKQGGKTRKQKNRKRKTRKH
jgi:hypothetical protein